MSSSGAHDFLDNDSVCRTFKSKCRRLFHSGPILGISLVIVLSICGISICISTLFRVSNFCGWTNLVVFCTVSFYTIRNYVLSAWYGPGFVELGWSPRKPEFKPKLQYCSLCEGYKAPRAHHCKTCGRCVLKMDHHCPWINCCVGHLNHGVFLNFVLSAPLGCLHVSGMCAYRIYYIFTRSYILFRNGLDYRLAFSIYDVVFALICLGLALGVTFSVGALAYFQLRGISRNRTVIEDWIMVKANDRRLYEENVQPMIYPYDLGWKENIRQVFSWSGDPVGDGYKWRLKPGCNEYDLTVEQLLQKKAKGRTSCAFNIVRAYGGEMMPIWFGCRTCCCQPCSGENRLAVAVGDSVLVTRGHKCWYYGQLVHSSNIKDIGSKKTTNRGWFPKACAVQAEKGKVKTN